MHLNILGLMILLFINYVPIAQAVNPSPTGLWKTIDDRTGKPRSMVRITEHNGEFRGVIEQGLLPTDKEDDACDQCTDDRKGQRKIGMTILKGIYRKDDKFEAGEILDPDNGEVYRCQVKLDATGNHLEVRGYIGIPILGRTQTWIREE